LEHDSCMHWSMTKLGAALLSNAPGRFCDLKQGPCHYLYDECTGAETQVTAVLVHGFVGSHVYFDNLAHRLASHGKVLRYDMYGRGFTPTPAGAKMTTELFVQQLLELLEQLGEQCVDLLGYSMGGGIALSFASQYPTKVRNLCVVAPVGFPSMRASLPKFLPCMLRVPGLAFLLGLTLVRLGFKRRSSYGREWLMEKPGDPDRLKELHDKELLRFPREGWSMPHSAINSLLWFSWGEIGTGVSSFSGPVVVIWGSNDRTVPEATKEASEFLPQAKMIVLKGHGHAIPLERPDLVVDAFEALRQPVHDDFEASGSRL